MSTEKMDKETILTFVGASCSDIAIKNAILMAEDKDAHLSIVVIAVAPQIYSYGFASAYSSYANIDQWSKDVEELGDVVDAEVAHIATMVQAANISADVLAEYCELPIMSAAVMRHGNVADRVVLLDGSGLTGDLKDLVVSSILFDTPVGLILGVDSHLAAVKPAHIFIAWDSTNNAAAAVHSALPLLATSEQVTIAVFDPSKRDIHDGEEPGADLASWLSRHGCHVNIEQYPSGGDEIGACILKRAMEKGADLVVMGAYGHMKLKQQVFGGTTQTMLQQDRFPVLIAHK